LCPLAKALDVLGERWTLLIVRDLIPGPKRYSDLRAGLRGLATDLLATRLRELEAADVIRKREIPPPTPATVYELAERGHALKPAVLELARWGRPFLSEASDDDQFPTGSLPVGFWAAFRPEAAAGIDETYDIEIDGRRFALHVHDETLEVQEGPARDAVVRIVTDERGFAEIARGRVSDRVVLEGDPEALTRMRQAFSFAPPGAGRY
jgi:DNA-binding HxlR family transcriptional regulator